jgi:hypothetical protein
VEGARRVPGGREGGQGALCGRVCGADGDCADRNVGSAEVCADKEGDQVRMGPKDGIRRQGHPHPPEVALCDCAVEAVHTHKGAAAVKVGPDNNNLSRLGRYRLWNDAVYVQGGKRQICGKRQRQRQRMLRKGCYGKGVGHAAWTQIAASQRVIVCLLCTDMVADMQGLRVSWLECAYTRTGSLVTETFCRGSLASPRSSWSWKRRRKYKQRIL